MPYIKLAVVAIFSLMILIPLVGFRFGEGIVSEIDNRKLQEYPFRAEERAKKKPMRELISAYVSDRIGFRDDMILAYTVLNDKLFGEMVHRSYRYGKDGHVFFRGMYTPTFGKYHETFVDMVKQIQDYCEARGVSFLFVYEPQKNDILEQYLPCGVHYDNRWVGEFFRALDARGIHYVDNTVTMREKMEEGKMVFNPKYDAGHWNDLGRFYGVNAVLSELHKTFPGIQPNDLGKFEQSQKLQSSLPASRFPIHEYVPDIIVPLDVVENLTDQYKDELKRHPSYRDFGYTKNPAHLKDAPRTMAFQGSHLNGRGSKFFQYALGEYIYVHNYQNVIDFAYYFNIFRPKCVIFEVAEFVLLDKNYFDMKKMEMLHLNPLRSSVVREMDVPLEQHLPASALSVQQGKSLTKIIWKNAFTDIEYAWCILGDEFDMRPSTEGGYEVTVKNEVWQKYQKEMQIVTMNNSKLQIYYIQNSPS